MNELIFIFQSLLCLTLLLVSLRFGPLVLTVVASICAVTMNIAVMKELTLFGLTVTGGNVLYSAIFFSTDVMHEHYGPQKARQLVWIGFASSFFFMLMTQAIVLYAPNSFDASQPHLEFLFGFDRYGRILLASMASFLMVQHLDVYLYGWIKRATQGRHLWLRNNGSTCISQLLDSIFFTVAGLYGNFIHTFEEVVQVILFTYIVKLFVAALDTPFIYLSKLPFFKPRDTVS